MLKGYKYSLMPTEHQKEVLANFFGCCRFVYNLGLETKMQAWVSARKNLTCIDLANQMKQLKDSDAIWLKDCPSQALQMSLRNLDNAYTAFFKGSGFPKFKSKHSKQSIQFPQGVCVDFDNNLIFIPKLKYISCFYHRRFSGEIKTVTISKTASGKYFVSLLVDNQKELPKKKPVKQKTSVGIDLGIKSFAALSNGECIENPKFLQKSLSRLRVEQKKLSRRFSKGAAHQTKSYLKQKILVARLHEKIKNQRSDFLHKTSFRIIQGFDTVCLEDLNIRGMAKNVNLSIRILDASWYMFKEMLEYKASWYGKNIIEIGRFDPSSKLCSNCGHIFKELSLNNRFWTCSSCGSYHDRDCNAAKNIKSFGLRNKPSTVNVSR